MKQVFRILLCFGLLLSLWGCQQEKSSQNEQKTYKVNRNKLSESLHFSGRVEPLSEYSLSAPVDAVVERVYKHYGQWVKKDEVIASLSSNSLQKQYNDSLTEYLKAKDSYHIAQAKFSGSKDLWKAGLMAKNSYLSEKSSLANARVNFIQARAKLLAMLSKMDNGKESRWQELSKLSLDQFERIGELLNQPHDKIQLRAPADGLLLYPSAKSASKQLPLTAGQAVKADDVIALVGDLSGIRVEIDVSEIDIDKLQPGMKARISSLALGQNTLDGRLVTVNAQARESSGSGLPSFTALVEVASLNRVEQKAIKIGMSANIEMLYPGKDSLLVPLQAIQLDGNQAFVHLKNAKGKIEKKIVITAGAQGDKVRIQSGLHEGDEIVYG